jgi:serine/threonine-protein kinase
VETRTAPSLIAGRYRVDGLLGEGGMARVFDAFDERLERPVAVKILRAETQALPGMRQRFQQEALLAARLIHPNIVAVLDFGEEEASSFLVMERLPGNTLRDEIVARGPLPTPRVLGVMAETLGALAAAHKFGVLHRDIKPSNILLQEDGHTKISDFGIAKSFDLGTDLDRPTDDMTLTGVVLGTPGYLAPERRSGQPATVQSDLYSVGAVMVEMLTGQRDAPGTAATEALPPSLRDVARRALAPDPRERFASAAEMLQTLSTRAPASTPTRRLAPTPPALTNTATEPMRPPPGPPGTAIMTRPRPEPPRPPRRRVRRRRVLAAAVVALAVVAALVLLLGDNSPPPGPAASATKHHVARQPRTQATTTLPTDAESSAISALAATLASGGFPGDGALASALQAAAAQQPGVGRQSSAQEALSLAQVLLDGGGITPGQYQDVVNVLQATGVTITPTPATAPLPGAPVKGHGHGQNQGDSGGG